MQLAVMRDEIIAQLEGLDWFTSVMPWSGDIETLLGQPKAAKSAFVAVAGGRFHAPATIPPGRARCDLLWDVVLFLPANADADSIDAVAQMAIYGGLTGLRPTGGGMLWPSEFELVSSSGLTNVYRITFEMTAN